MDLQKIHHYGPGLAQNFSPSSALRSAPGLCLGQAPVGFDQSHQYHLIPVQLLSSPSIRPPPPS